MYGTRDASQNWENAYAAFMREIGFKQGKSTPCVFYHEYRGVRAVAHGDDFTVLGPTQGLDWFLEKIGGRYAVKYRGRLGPEQEDDKVIRILNRIVEWSPEGIRYAADKSHAEIIIKHLGLSADSKAVTTPGVKDLKEEADGEDEGTGEELRPPKKLPDPIEPTREERDAHNLSGCAVFRSWCRHCMRGRAREWSHRSAWRDKEGNQIPTIYADYGYLCAKSETAEDERAA